jgi:peptide chain release factor 2
LPLGGIFDVETKSQRLEEVNGLLEDPKIWSDNAKSQALGKEKRELGLVVESLIHLQSGLQDAQDLFDMAREENDDATLLSVASDAQALEKQIAEMEFRRMFSGPMDANNCFIEFQSGSGGTEAQDWCNMLLRMYLRYTERKGFKVEVLELSDGDVAGIKGASIKVSGDYAYGTLRTESGVHRLVRKSPFDSNAKRHTSFASVQIFPEVDDSIEIDINPADLRVDTYRASGAGGQHINKTDSAVRITHLPSGLVVECQDERSQHKNRSRAMSLLKAKLRASEQEKREVAQARERKLQVGSGDRSERIRTYNFPQGRVTDHRINLTLYQLDAIMEGRLEDLIEPLLQEHQAELLAEEEA